MWTAHVLILLVLLPSNLNAIKFEGRCKLVKELIRAGLPLDSFMGSWVCLIEQVSGRDTSRLTETSSGKKAYGLFQIPSRWCREGRPGGECNISCESLLDNDIREDVQCAKVVFNREGFKYWPIWERRCKNNVQAITDEIYKCPDLLSWKAVRQISYPGDRKQKERGQ